MRHIFCQNLHIAYLSAYNGIFRIAHAKVMPLMQKFIYICIYDAYFRISLSNVVIRLLNIFGGRRLPVFTIRH